MPSPDQVDSRLGFLPCISRPHHSPSLVLVLVPVVLLFGQDSAASALPPPARTTLKTETFDRDPGWDGKGNRLTPSEPPTVRQDFGYSAATNHAGRARGEVGGEVWRSITPAYYGKAIPEMSFDTQGSAAGSLALLRARAISGWQTGATIFIGWFRADPRDLIWRPRNFIGFRLEASNEPDGALVELCYGTAAWQAGGAFVNAGGGAQERNVKELESAKLLRIPPDGSRHAWSLRLDPGAGAGTGEVILVFDGAETRVRISAEHRKAGARCDRFGIFACRIPGRSMVAYLDDITLEGRLEDFSVDPGWEGAGNRASFRDTAQYACNDFGFSATTHHAGGARPGELGGRFMSCDPDEEQFKGYYGDRIGLLTLDDTLFASGKLAADEFCIDSTFALGWFNSKKQGWPIENFVGVYFDSLSPVGRIAEPLYGLAGGSTARGGGHVTFEPGGKQYDWTLSYDPAAAGGQGTITFTIGGQSVTRTLRPGEREKGAAFDRFGVFNMQWANSKWCDVYLDDLTYSVGPKSER